MPEPHAHCPTRQLTLFDSTCLITGIIIGAGIYQMAPDVARGAGGVWSVLGLWLLGGVLSLCGAAGYAELAAAFPKAGGDYIYLNRAYGPWAGFLFGWIQTAIVRPGDIAIMAFAFGLYAQTLWDPFPQNKDLTRQLYAAGAVLVLTLINLAGVRPGKWTQNILTVAKAAGLVTIAGVAFFLPVAPAHPDPPSPAAIEPLPTSLALIFVLFVYGGWNEMAYVAAEVNRPQRNIPRALALGTLAVTGLYLLVNGAFLHTLGYAGVAASQTVAADTVGVFFPRSGAMAIAALVAVSALGAVNGLIFAGARIAYALGSDHRLFRGLGHWYGPSGTPAAALVMQGVLSLALILALGSFTQTILYTAPVVYTFYLATSLAVIVLRRKEPRTERPYRVTLYPFPTLLFAAVCAFLVYSAVAYRPWIAGAALGIGLLGLPLYWYSRGKP